MATDQPTKHPALILSPAEIAFLVVHSGDINPGTGAGTGAISASHFAEAIAIIMSESGGNVYALNSVPPDESYGLAQINMFGGLGPDRRARYNLKSNEDLYMADLNVAIMGQMSKGGENWHDWSTFVSKAYLVNMGVAQDALQHPVDPKPRLRTPEQAAADNSKSPLDRVLDFIKSGVLRIAGFIGGGILLILAIILYVKTQGKK